MAKAGLIKLPRAACLAAIADPARLEQAWRRVRANQGGPGGDGVTLAMFSQRSAGLLRELHGALLSGRYRPGPLRRAPIPKKDGRTRWLAIPGVVDRVAQTAALQVLQPLLETRQSDASFAYRPARGVADAVAAVRAAHGRGLVWTLEADIADYFDRIAHARLMAELAIWLEADPVLALMARWLHGFDSHGRGIAQGAPIAPLLANLYLHPLDRLLSISGYVPVRYADDFVIAAATREAAGAACRLARGVLRERGLDLVPAKTRVVPPGTPFVFLGQKLLAMAPRRIAWARR